MIWFNQQEQSKVQSYLNSEAKDFVPALDEATALIEGFESPFGMELLSTVDWLIYKDGCQPTVESIKEGMANWSAGKHWADRKLSLFKDEHIQYALEKLQELKYVLV